MMPVVARDRAATKAAMNTSASIGRERLIKAESRPTFDFSCSLAAVSLAGVLELRPRRMASKPETPLTEASSFGALNRAIGPKITRVLDTHQAMIAIKIQAP